jgi:hypothetical protein
MSFEDTTGAYSLISGVVPNLRPNYLASLTDTSFDPSEFADLYYSRSWLLLQSLAAEFRRNGQELSVNSPTRRSTFITGPLILALSGCILLRRFI